MVGRELFPEGGRPVALLWCRWCFFVGGGKLVECEPRASGKWGRAVRVRAG